MKAETSSKKTETYFLDNVATIYREDYPTYYQYLKDIKAAKRHFSFCQTVTGGMKFFEYVQVNGGK